MSVSTIHFPWKKVIIVEVRARKERKEHKEEEEEMKQDARVFKKFPKQSMSKVCRDRKDLGK